MDQVTIVYKKKGKFIYAQDSEDNHHVIKHSVRLYWKYRKSLPDKCIIHESIEELKEALKIA